LNVTPIVKNFNNIGKYTENKTGNVRINVTLRGVRATIVAVEEQ
jgi:hypothetical protein